VACREHAYSRSNDLTDRHAADKVLADKALERIARDSALSERAAAAVWAGMKAKTKISMGMKPKKTTRKKAMKKQILTTAKRGGAFSANVGHAWVLNQRSGQRGENNSKIARRRAAMSRSRKQDRGLYLAPYKIRARIIISAHTNVDNV